MVKEIQIQLKFVIPLYQWDFELRILLTYGHSMYGAFYVLFKGFIFKIVKFLLTRKLFKKALCDKFLVLLLIFVSW